jgi:hypothetical protein
MGCRVQKSDGPHYTATPPSIPAETIASFQRYTKSELWQVSPPAAKKARSARPQAFGTGFVEILRSFGFLAAV